MTHSHGCWLKASAAQHRVLPKGLPERAAGSPRQVTPEQKRSHSAFQDPASGVTSHHFCPLPSGMHPSPSAVWEKPTQDTGHCWLPHHTLPHPATFRQCCWNRNYCISWHCPCKASEFSHMLFPLPGNLFLHIST